MRHGLAASEHDWAATINIWGIAVGALIASAACIYQRAWDPREKHVAEAGYQAAGLVRPSVRVGNADVVAEADDVAKAEFAQEREQLLVAKAAVGQYRHLPPLRHHLGQPAQAGILIIVAAGRNFLLPHGEPYKRGRPSVAGDQAQHQRRLVPRVKPGGRLSSRSKSVQSIATRISRWAPTCCGTQRDAGSGVEECLNGGDQPLDIAGKSAVPAQPSEEPLDDQAPLVNLKADLIVGLAHDLDRDAGRVGHALARIGRVYERQHDEGKRSARRFQQRHSPITVLNVGGMHDDREQPPVRIHQGVAFAPLHFLPRVIPSRASGLCRLGPSAAAGLQASHMRLQRRLI